MAHYAGWGGNARATSGRNRKARMPVVAGENRAALRDVEGGRFAASCA